MFGVLGLYDTAAMLCDLNDRLNLSEASEFSNWELRWLS